MPPEALSMGPNLVATPSEDEVAEALPIWPRSDHTI
jgi:hypothetical protein